MLWVFPIKVMLIYNPFYFQGVTFAACLIVGKVFRNRMGIGFGYAAFPLSARNPICGLPVPIVELGFWVVQFLKVNGGLVGILKVVLGPLHINNVMAQPV